MKPLYIAVTGGGTGGHLYPLLAVVEEARALATSMSQETRVRFFGAAGTYKELFAASNIPVSSIVPSKMRAYFSIRNFFAPFLFLYGFLQALWKMYWFMPHIVFSKGGPGSLSVLFAAVLYRIPIIIHESDASPGRSNTIAARFAARIAVSYESTKQYFPGRADSGQKNIVVSGNPIRSSLAYASTDAKTARAAFGLQPNIPTILVINGSQGSVRINTFMLSLADTLIRSYQVIHQTGLANYDTCVEQLKKTTGHMDGELRQRYKLIPYFEENLREAYAAADLVVARAGGSLFEIAASGKPAILIPLKGSAREHQRDNAYEYAKVGGAVVIEEDNLLVGIFMNEVDKILSSSDVRYAMAAAARRFARPDAARILAQEIIHVAEQGGASQKTRI